MHSVVLAMVNPSVHHTLAAWHCVKITQTHATIMQSWLENSPMTSFFVVNFTTNIQGNIWSGVSNWELSRKNLQFSGYKVPYLWNGARWNHGYYDGLIGSRIGVFDWYHCTKIIHLGWPWTAYTHSSAEKMHFSEPNTKNNNRGCQQRHFSPFSVATSETGDRLRPALLYGDIQCLAYL